MLSCSKLAACWKTTKKVVEAHDAVKDVVDNVEETKAHVDDVNESTKKIRRKQTEAGKIESRKEFVPRKDEQKQTRFSKTCPRIANACRRVSACSHRNYTFFSVILSSLFAVAAFYNDFISDVQILLMIATIPNYRYLCLVMGFFMAIQYYLAVKAISSYLETCVQHKMHAT